MSQLSLPGQIDEILSAPCNRYIGDAKSEGQQVIAYTCSFIPEPLISVPGLVPIRPRAPGISSTPLADTYLSSVLCSYTRSLLEVALEGEFDFLDGWIFASSCDHLRRLYDNLTYQRLGKFFYILDLPHKTGEAAENWFASELRHLAEAIDKELGIVVNDQTLWGSISQHNAYLQWMQRFGELRLQPRPPITGTSFHKLLTAGTVVPKTVLMKLLNPLLDDLSTREGTDSPRARLMLLGNTIADPAFLQVIESLGGLVVADRFCFGSIPGFERIPEEGQDPFKVLAAHAIKHTACPRMMGGFEGRTKRILDAINDFSVDGVIVQNLKFCDLWGVETQAIVECLRAEKIPTLRLEREYSLSGIGQLRTRIQAFLESMGR